jgi:anti-anti-sigma factor
MKLTLLSIESGYVRAAAEGRITSEDFLTTGEKHHMEALLGSNWATMKVLLDMSRVSYVDSSAVGWLINCNKQFKTNGGMLVLHSIPVNVGQIFELLNIGKVLTLVENERAAKALVTGVVQ